MRKTESFETSFVRIVNDFFYFRFLFQVSIKPRGVEQCLGEVSFTLFINGSRSDRWKWDCHKVTSNNCGISFRQKFMYLEDMLKDNHELQYLLETTFQLFRQEEGETLLYLSLFQILVSLRGQEYSLLPCKDIFRILVLMQDRMFCGSPTEPTSNECPVMLGNEKCFLFQTAMDFSTVHICVQAHIRERFRMSSDLEGTTHQIEAIQHC